MPALIINHARTRPPFSAHNTRIRATMPTLLDSINHHLKMIAYYGGYRKETL